MTSLSAPAVLDREFLEIRARVLELAACFDRLDRAEGSVEGDPRLARLSEAITVLQGAAPHRAEKVQLIFSREYEPQWRDQFGIS
jgi:hypothetical protein